MSPTVVGAVVGGVGAIGVLTALRALRLSRRVDPGLRIWPYLRDLPEVAATPVAQSQAARWHRRLLGWSGSQVDRILGGAPSVRRRLDRLGSEQTVHDFRIEQVGWGLAGFALVAGVTIIRAATGSVSNIGALTLALTAFAFGVLLRDNRLTAQVRRHERRLVEELPALTELLALSVAAGEGPVAALERVVRRSRGALSSELTTVLADMRTGTPLALAFDSLASRTGAAEVRRFAEAVAVAVERGTPLADLLHAQAADVREARRRDLIEVGARKELLMMVPVVFLVLPATVLVAFWPGAVGLSFVTI